MTITYIFHSGFAIETKEAILVFDYWHDPANVMQRLMNVPKPMYVFSSHFHEDHFTKRIFEWRARKGGVKYILSKDILKRRRAGKEDSDVWMAKGAVWEDEIVKVAATGSNDSGVSWIVEVEGKRIFHAGDLNNWYARFLSEENADENIINDELECINPVAEEKRFLGELKDIHKISGTFDLAMFPVDGRIGNGYTLGGRQFIDRFDVRFFVPMHFVASGFESAWRMEQFCKDKGVEFWRIGKEGETKSIIFS